MGRVLVSQRTDHARRHNVKRAHDGDEEGEGRKHDELHDWGVRGGPTGIAPNRLEARGEDCSDPGFS
jgi:hypothetical protein